MRSELLGDEDVVACLIDSQAALPDPADLNVRAGDDLDLPKRVSAAVTDEDGGLLASLEGRWGEEDLLILVKAEEHRGVRAPDTGRYNDSMLRFPVDLREMQFGPQVGSGPWPDLDSGLADRTGS